jgi:hypothetical protein
MVDTCRNNRGLRGTLKNTSSKYSRVQISKGDTDGFGDVGICINIAPQVSSLFLRGRYVRSLLIF